MLYPRIGLTAQDRKRIDDPARPTLFDVNDATGRIPVIQSSFFIRIVSVIVIIHDIVEPCGPSLYADIPINGMHSSAIIDIVQLSIIISVVSTLVIIVSVDDDRPIVNVLCCGDDLRRRRPSIFDATSCRRDNHECGHAEHKK